MSKFISEVATKARENFKTVFRRRIDDENDGGMYAKGAMIGAIVLDGLFLSNGNPTGAGAVSIATLGLCYEIENAVPIVLEAMRDLVPRKN